MPLSESVRQDVSQSIGAKGVALETIEDVRKLEDGIMVQVVQLKYMPLRNETGLKDEESAPSAARGSPAIRVRAPVPANGIGTDENCLSYGFRSLGHWSCAEAPATVFLEEQTSPELCQPIRSGRLRSSPRSAAPTERLAHATRGETAPVIHGPTPLN